MLTVPVDLVFVNDCLVPTLSSARETGASVDDEDGPQPLVALWNVAALRGALAFDDDLSVQGLQARLHMLSKGVTSTSFATGRLEAT